MSWTVSIDMPLRRQFSDSTCVAACIAMILSRYGYRRSVRRIAHDLGTGKTVGTTYERAGLYLCGLGYDVVIYGWSSAYPNRFLHLPDDHASDEVRSWLNGPGARAHLSVSERRYAQAFLEVGGRILPRPVTLADIQRGFRRGQPCILGVNSGLIMPVHEKVIHHAVVPVRIERQVCTIHDPYPAKYGGRQELPMWQIMFANQFDGGHALFVSC